MTLIDISRLEAQRRLRSLPKELLDSRWASDVQVEAVIDALLALSTKNQAQEVVHARNTGEWAYRIAQNMQGGVEPKALRACGVLCEIDANVLEQIPEVRHCAEIVRSFQFAYRTPAPADEIGAYLSMEAHIVAAASQFDSWLIGFQCEPLSARESLRLLNESPLYDKRVISALHRALHRNRKQDEAA